MIETAPQALLESEGDALAVAVAGHVQFYLMGHGLLGAEVLEVLRGQWGNASGACDHTYDNRGAIALWIAGLDAPPPSADRTGVWFTDQVPPRGAVPKGWKVVRARSRASLVSAVDDLISLVGPGVVSTDIADLGAYLAGLPPVGRYEACRMRRASALTQPVRTGLIANLRLPDLGESMDELEWLLKAAAERGKTDALLHNATLTAESRGRLGLFRF